MNKDREEKKKELEYFSARIKEVREKLGLSRAEMAEKLNVSTVHVHQIETYGAGSWPIILDILKVFYKVGKINPLWMIIEDNKNISMHYKELDNQDLIKMLGEQLVKEGFVQRQNG